MKQLPSPPPRSLVLRDGRFPECTLRVTPSNQGDPYRETLSLTFERGAHGSWAHYEHLGSVELEADEEQELFALLKARQEPGGKRT